MCALWEDGAKVVADDFDWEPLLHPLGDRRAAKPKSFVWYRVMASSAALLSNDDMLTMSGHYYLAHAISDTLALRDADDREAPTDLIPEICREQARRPDACLETRLFATLGELLTAELEARTPAAIVMLCDALEHIEQSLCNSGNYRAPQYVWGATHFDSHHAVWLRLVRDHFPSHVPQASKLRDTLLEHGARWVDTADAHAAKIADDELDVTEYNLGDISFFLRRARSNRARAVALRLAESCFGSVAQIDRSDDRLSSWLSAMNNAIHAAHASGEFDLAARWANIAKPYAGDNAHLPYNLACAFAAVGRRDDAFAMCTLAVEMGDLTNLEQLRNDEDLGPLRSEARFVALFRGRDQKRNRKRRNR